MGSQLYRAGAGTEAQGTVPGTLEGRAAAQIRAARQTHCSTMSSIGLCCVFLFLIYLEDYFVCYETQQQQEGS